MNPRLFRESANRKEKQTRRILKDWNTKLTLFSEYLLTTKKKLFRILRRLRLTVSSTEKVKIRLKILSETAKGNFIVDGVSSAFEFSCYTETKDEWRIDTSQILFEGRHSDFIDGVIREEGETLLQL